MIEDTTPPPNSPAVAGLVKRPVRPFAWVDPLYLRVRQTGGLMTVTDFPGEVRTAPLFTQSALDAAVAAERERLIEVLRQDAIQRGGMRRAEFFAAARDLMRRA